MTRLKQLWEEFVFRNKQTLRVNFVFVEINHFSYLASFTIDNLGTTDEQLYLRRRGFIEIRDGTKFNFVHEEQFRGRGCVF